MSAPIADIQPLLYLNGDRKCLRKMFTLGLHLIHCCVKYISYLLTACARFDHTVSHAKSIDPKIVYSAKHKSTKDALSKTMNLSGDTQRRPKTAELWL